MKQEGLDLLYKYKNALFFAFLGVFSLLGILIIFFIFNSDKTYWSLPEKINSSDQLLNTAEIAFHERFGAPSSRINIENSVILQYRNSSCVMNIFLDDRKQSLVKKSQHILLLDRTDLKENKKCLQSFILS